MSMVATMADFYLFVKQPDKVSIGCLRALVDFSQRNLSRETTEERDWRAAGPKTRSSQRLQPKNAVCSFPPVLTKGSNGSN